MLESVYDLPEADQNAFFEKESVLRKQHELVILFSECDECFDKFEVRDEPRDGYICPLNDVAYCECDPEGPEGLGVDADHWDCPVYLKALEELKSEFGVTEPDS
jgi:hypothetical protein